MGALSAQFATAEEWRAEVKRWMAEVPSISVGLSRRPGAVLQSGDDCRPYHPAHVNQDLYRQSGCSGSTGGDTGGEQTHINARSARRERSARWRFLPASAAARTPARVSQKRRSHDGDMGAHAAFFPMGGEKSLPRNSMRWRQTAARHGMTRSSSRPAVSH
ncbi:oxo-acid lyase [Salmonella enterica subsp. enterica]|nr:oxo-acid lyase [Salmonella enterica subsp. enterica]